MLTAVFFFFIVQTLSFMHCTCNFICGLSDVIIKTFSQSAMQSLSLVVSECFLSGRGQGHVSNFYTVDLENFATASRRYTGDIGYTTRPSRFVYDTLPPTKLPTSYHRFGQDLSYK